MQKPENPAQSPDDLAATLLTENRRARFQQVVSRRLNCLTAVFECISDPQNVSACIRTAELFGLAEIYLLGGPDAKPNHQISMAAERWMKIHHCTDLSALVQTLRSNGFTIIGTLANAQAKPFAELPLPAKTALVFGTERYGLSDAFCRECDEFIFIPMAGFTQSLNLSAAAAILVQHFQAAYRQRGGDIHLDSNEQDLLIRRWTERDVRTKLRQNRQLGKGPPPFPDKPPY